MQRFILDGHGFHLAASRSSDTALCGAVGDAVVLEHECSCRVCSSIEARKMGTTAHSGSTTQSA